MNRRSFLVALAGVAAVPQLARRLVTRPPVPEFTAAELDAIARAKQLWVLAPHQVKLLGELADRGYQAAPWFYDRRPIAGRRLLVPVWTDRGIEELVYERARPHQMWRLGVPLHTLHT